MISFPSIRQKPEVIQTASLPWQQREKQTKLTSNGCTQNLCGFHTIILIIGGGHTGLRTAVCHGTASISRLEDHVTNRGFPLGVGSCCQQWPPVPGLGKSDGQVVRGPGPAALSTNLSSAPSRLDKGEGTLVYWNTK